MFSDLQKEPDIADVAAKPGAGFCLMHTGRDRDKLDDVIADQFLFWNGRLRSPARAGVARECIVLDPGFGFAKDTQENFELMATVPTNLHRLGCPLLAGTSRKRFVGAVTGRDAADRDAGTAATSVVLRLKGAAIFRVHDVAINRDALAVADAMLAARDEHSSGRARHEHHLYDHPAELRLLRPSRRSRRGGVPRAALFRRCRTRCDRRHALESDSIDDTVNYGIAFTVIEEIVTGKRRYLIEALALDIAKGLCEKFPQITRAKITVRKPNAPVPGVLDFVQVSVEHFV
jgi:dihydroneopterin aldolase